MLPADVTGYNTKADSRNGILELRLKKGQNRKSPEFSSDSPIFLTTPQFHPFLPMSFSPLSLKL